MPGGTLTHGPVDAQGNATGLDHDVLMKVMSNLPGLAPWREAGRAAWQETGLQGEGYGLAMLGPWFIIECNRRAVRF